MTHSKMFAAVTALAATIASAACHNTPANPLAPSSPGKAPRYPMQHTATTPDGRLVYVCATQARIYIVNGRSVSEIDHYTQDTPCPIIPIK